MGVWPSSLHQPGAPLLTSFTKIPQGSDPCLPLPEKKAASSHIPLEKELLLTRPLFFSSDRLNMTRSRHNDQLLYTPPFPQHAGVQSSSPFPSLFLVLADFPARIMNLKMYFSMLLPVSLCIRIPVHVGCTPSESGPRPGRV